MTRISEQSPFDLLLMTMLRPHRLMVILFWRLFRKRMRARGQLETAIAGLPFATERRIRGQHRADLTVLDSAKAKGTVPKICVHLHYASTDDPSDLKRAIESIERQTFAPLRAFITSEEKTPAFAKLTDRCISLSGPFANRMEGLQAALREAQQIGGTWVIPSSTASEMPRQAIAAYGARLLEKEASKQPVLIYTDTVAKAGSLWANRYWLKPLWDPRMFLSQDYITQGFAVAVEPSLQALAQHPISDDTSLYEFVWSVAQEGEIEHLNRVAAREEPGQWAQSDDRRMKAVQSMIGGAGDVSEGEFGTTQIRWGLPSRLPTVSVLVATRDRVDLLRTCVEGVLHSTDYPALDLVIADNESVEPETLAYMDKVASDPRVQVVRWPHPFNYSAINNFAAEHATGEYLCLLNNDIEVIDPAWLTHLMREAVQPGIGAVGARLLYPDRSIQHAGVAIGIGNAAGHAHRALPEGEPGYFAQALIARGASAVTAACLVVRKDHFDAVGGLDEQHLAVAYNDVDLCLKLQERGLRNIYTPLATLIHHESKSRGQDFAPENLDRYMRELAVFQQRWSTKIAVDPWHHPQLARGKEVYSTH